MGIRNAKLNGTDWETGNILSKEDLNDTNNSMYEYAGPLGEVKMFALSTTGAVTKSTLQSNGWAICDGTTSVAQGITSPTITTTPNLQDRFIKMSSDESSGTTGGSNTHNHTGYTGYFEEHNGTGSSSSSDRINGPHRHTISSDSNIPKFMEMAFFIKVK